MEYRPLGHSGLYVSPLCLGTMMFGGRSDEAVAQAIIGHARDTGVNFIDTADVYNGGRSEEIVGRALKADRERWVLATKAGNKMSDDPNQRGSGRRWLMQAAEDSLRRLAVDHVDVFYLHREDPETPVEETVLAVGDLIRDGKVRYFGVSNFRAWRLAELVAACDRLGVPRPIVSQPYYNAMNRMPEVEHLPACGHFGLGVVPYSPLARGVLTGKYVPDSDPDAESRAGSGDARILETEWRQESLTIARKIKAHAEARGTTASHFAINWLLNNRLVTAPVCGPRTLDQWRDYVAALEAPFTAEDEALVDRLVTPGHASTPGYNDPEYPLEGRQPRTDAS